MRYLGGMVLLAAVICLGMDFKQQALAACPGSPSVPGGVYGRLWNCSYFDNIYGQFPNQYSWLLISNGATRYDGLTQDWATNGISYATFMNSLHDRVFDGTSQINAARASAIVDIMLGKKGTDFINDVAGVSYARTHWTDFVNLVSAYNSGAVPGYSVNFNAFFDFSSVNSNGWGLYDPNPTSDFSCITVRCYPDAIFASPFVDTTSDFAVVFYYPSGQFIIKDKCGNLTGDTAAPPMPPTSINITKTSSNPAPMTIGTNMTYSFNIKENVPIALSTVNITDTLPSEFQYVSPASGAPPTSVCGCGNLTWNFTAAANPAIIAAIESPAGYDMSVNVTAVSAGNANNIANGTATDTSGNPVPVVSGSVTNTVTSPSISHPSVIGESSDIHAGGGLCGSALTGSGVINTNPLAGSYGDFVVSGSGLVSNIGSNGSPGDTSLRLGPNGSYTEVCRPDLYQSAMNNKPGGASTVGSGTYPLNSAFTGPPVMTMVGPKAVSYINGPVTLHGTWGQNYPLTIVVNGSVTIDSDINVAPVGTGKGDAPAVAILASGPIDIKSSATNVRAMLFSGSVIDTCFTPAHPVFPECNNTLTVYGFLMAPSILLHRLGP